MKVVLSVLLLWSSLGRAADCDPSLDIAEALGCLTGVTSREIPLSEDPKIPAGYRRFELWIQQPVDHANPKAGTFRQKLALLHKGTSEPMVLQTSGYAIFSIALSSLAKTFQANQVQVEHRFFDQSTPAVHDWTKLDIRQSAHDFHRITVELKKLYRARWVNTGASKGGMTSTYHRRFFPDDTDGTVADVAPLSFSTTDQRYVSFVNGAGGKRYLDCRERLEALQIALLKRRDEVQARIQGSFLYLGGKDVAYEHAVVELSFAFWQYQNPEDPKVGCAKVPSADVPAADLAAFLAAVNAVPDYGDARVFAFMPYYFQAATQLGSPAARMLHLTGLRRYDYTIHQYTPRLSYTYTNRFMLDVDKWARKQADHILFVYGEFDPWTAAAYPKQGAGSDYHWFQVPGGNHSAKLFQLPEPEKSRALAVVAKWLNKPPAVRGFYGETLDDLELAARRRAKLP